MHRVLSSKTTSTIRQINDKGEMISRKKDDLEMLPFSARTPRVTQRAKTQLTTTAKPKTIIAHTITSQSSTSKLNKSKNIQQFYSDPRNQAKDLMAEGVHCTATNQKHEIINQLGNLLLQQINQTEIYQNDVEHLEAKIRELEIEVVQQKNSTEKISKNAARVTKLRHLKTVRSDEDLIEDIRTIETDAQKYVHLSEPWLLQEIIESEADEKMEELINLKFRRLEDLIYALRRQILQDQDIKSVLPLINDKFGSVRNLLIRYEDSLHTIEKLKVREFRISQDELTKRRPLATYDSQSLHMLVVALQNELIETKAQLRSAALLSKPSKTADKTIEIDIQSINENPIDFDLISKFNQLEASYSELLHNFENLKKDKDLFQSELNLESDILKTGIFKIEDKMKKKLEDANLRINEYYDKMAKMQNTIDLQQSLVNQFQKERALYLRQKMILNAEVLEMKEKVAKSEAEVRTEKRRFDSMRGVARVMAENTLARRADYSKSFEQINEIFFQAYQKFDSAALLIQRFWRKQRNPKYEKGIVTKNFEFPIPQIMATTALDVIAGKMKPVTYVQIVKLLKSYNNEIKINTASYLESMKKYIEMKHSDMNIVSESVLCKPKRFNWTQTEPDRIETETQTERVPFRGKK